MEATNSREIDGDRPLLRVGIIADVQHGGPQDSLVLAVCAHRIYLDKATEGSKAYRAALPKLKAALTQFVDEKVDFVISLGDIVDGSSEIPRPPNTRAQLVEALEAFVPLKSHGINVYHTLGNHCLYVSESKAGVVKLLEWKTDQAYAVVEQRSLFFK
jgi:hypothetical protein